MDQRSTVTKNAFFVGRKNLELPLFFDRCFDKNRIKTFIGWLLANFGENATVYIVEKLKNLGFYFATEAGISLSIDDLQVPSNKNWLLSQAEKDIKRNDNNFQCGNLTPVEQSQQLLDRWHRTSETLRESVIQSFRLTNTLNPVYMMAFSGARGNISQVRQLVGMRGLMADPQGQIISFPIRSNFREGLTLTEYVISCYGARKGVVDTALRTADSGYLTRRLVDVSQHVVVWTFDCKTDAGIHLTEMKEGKKIILSLKKRILGRVLAQEIPTIAFRNQQISAQLAQQIVSLKEHVLVRSPLSCNVPNSVCQLCYGWSLSRGRIVSLGEAVGVIAAQSIGEPGTQLTMRTFHTGGVFSGDVIDEIRAPHDGVVRFLQPLLGQLIRTSHGKIAYLTRASGSFVIENNSDVFKYLGSKSEQKPIESQTSQEGAVHFASKMQRASLEKVLNSRESIKSGPIFGTSNFSPTLMTLEPGTALFVRQGEKVIAKQLLAEYSSISAQTKERVEAQHQVYSDQKGEIFFDDVVLGKKLKKEEPETEKASHEGAPAFCLQNASAAHGSVLSLQNKLQQSEGDVFAKQKQEQQSGRRVDIVTSLKLNTLWILSGTFFEPPVSSTLYTKIGDLIDKTTLLTLIQSELNLQTSHSDGEYILSAQLKKNKTTKRKEKLVTFFRKSLASSKLPKISQNEASFFQRGNLEDHIKKRESLFLNQFSLNLTITNITYKKSGYFFTDCKKEKPYNLYSFFLQAGSANLINNFNNLKSYREKNKALNWNLGFGKVETNFLSFPKSYIVTKQKPLLAKEIKNLFVLAEPKERATFFSNFFFKNPSMRNIETVLLKNVINLQNKSKYKQASQEGAVHFASKMQNDSRILILEYSKESAKAKDLWWRSHNFPLKPSIRNSLSMDFAMQNAWFRKGTDSVTLDKKGKILRKNKIEDKKNINHFFTTTSLNQPFSNCREFKNEFILQWFSPFFKTKGGGLIYTNNYYCNKRSIEAHIFFIAEENYGKKDLGKMNFGTKKKSFNIVSFKELIAPSVCLTNVFLDGKKKPSFSSKNSFLLCSGNLANSLSNINIDVFSETKTRAKSNKKPSDFIERNVFNIKTDFGKKKPEENLIKDNRTISINSFLSEMSFLQNQNSSPTPSFCETKKELFFLRKKDNSRFYSALFHSTKTTPDRGETFNITINLLKKGFFSFKNKWVETDIPLGYQKNLQGNQIPFYSRENGVLKNSLAPSFFINQYSNFWGRKKSKRFSGSFLENFLPLTSKHPLPHIKMKNENFSSRNTFFIDSLYLNKKRFYSENEILIKNFNKKPLSEKLYQKEFWLGNLQKKGINSESTLSFNRAQHQHFASKMQEHFRAKPSFLQSKKTKTLFFKEKSSFLYSKEKMKKEKMKFFLLFLLTKSYLSLAKNKPLKFNPFPSKGNYSSSAFIFRINVKAIRGSQEGAKHFALQNVMHLLAKQFQRQSSVFYNSYPYPQPIFVNFLKNKSTANSNSSSKNLKTNLGLQNKHVVLQNQNLFSKRSSLVLQKQKQKINLKDLGEVKDSKFPQNLVLHNHNKNTKDKDKKLNKFSSFLQKQIEKSPTKKHASKGRLWRSHHKKTGENLQRSNLQIRSGWLYLPKDQFQTAKAHQSFIPPFQQKIDEILFDQFPVYVESILRKNFEEQLTDKYLQPSTNIVDFCKTKTLVEKSQLQKFIRPISNSKQPSHKNSRAVQDVKFAVRENDLQEGAAHDSANYGTPNVSIFKQRSNKFLLSLRETFWRGSTFSSFVENDFTTFYGGNHSGVATHPISERDTTIAEGDASKNAFLHQKQDNNEDIFKLSERGLSYQTNLLTNSSNHTTISSTSSFLSFLLRNKKERKTKYLQERNVFSQAALYPFASQEGANHESLQNPLAQKESTEKHGGEATTDAGYRSTNNSPSGGSAERHVFLRPVSINPIKIVFQVVTNKSCRFHSIQSFVLSCVNNRNFNFSQDSFLQSQIIERKLIANATSQNDTCTENKVNPSVYNTIPGSPKLFLCLPQISRIYFIKNKPFSDFVLVSRKLNLDQVKIRSTISSDVLPSVGAWKSENGVSNFFLRENTIFIGGEATIAGSANGETFGETSKSNIGDKQDQVKSAILSEKNKSLIYRAKQILVPTNKKLVRYNNLSKILQNKTFLIQNLSTEVDTDYLSFLVLIPTFLKSEKGVDTVIGGSTTDTLLATPDRGRNSNLRKETSSFQKKKLSFSEFFSEKSKLWLLIRKSAEYPLLDSSISQQKTRLHRGNQTFFEKELIYSSTPLSLYMSNRMTFSSKFNKQKKKEIYMSFYNSPKVGLKIKENIFYLLSAFSKLEKQQFANLSVDPIKKKFFEEKSRLPHNFFSCQNNFWQIFDLHCQNVQKNKFFEGKQPLFVKKTFASQEGNSFSEQTQHLHFASKMQEQLLAKPVGGNKKHDTEVKDLLKDNLSFQGGELLENRQKQSRTWFFQKENLENFFFPREKEQTIIRFFKQSYLLHFFLNFNISKQSPLQRIEIHTTFEKIEGSTQTSSCAHRLNLQEVQKKAKNEFFINRNNVKIKNLNLQSQKTSYLQKNDGQPQFLPFTGLNLNASQERHSVFDVDIFKKREIKNKEQNKIFPVETLRIILENNLNDNFYDKIKTNLLPQNSLFTKQLFLRNVEASQEGSLTSDRFRMSFSQEKRKKHGFNKMNFKLSQKKLEFWKYSFTPFARDLAFTLSFTAKLNQSWFFSLANKVENKRGTFLFEESQPLQGLEFSTFQNQKFIGAKPQLPQTIKESFIFASKTQLNENKTKQGYLKNKKLISKESSFYPLKERNSYTTLLLDQTITTYDKTPVAITAIMSREEGEIENLKGNSACLILKNSDIEILLTKKEKPLVVVGQLIRYGEEIANGIAAPKSGQIIQVDTNKVTLRKAQPILFPRGGSVDVSHGDYVKEGSPLLSLSYQRLVTGDIVQGIPKIEQLFEARETEGGQPLLSSLHSELEAIFLSYSTQLGLKLAVRESFKEIQQIIVDRVQRVYIAQGVLIADKHFEVVIRQMTSKVRILDGGRPGFLYGELVDLRRVELLNAGVPFANEQALYEPIILGISKACLEAEGFLSPASFQETTRVLSLAAIERKTDFLRGIKERVILGDVIQAGTGFTLYDRPVRKIKQEECIDLSLSVLHNARSILSTNHYYKQL